MKVVDGAVTVPRCHIGSGSVKGSKRITGWVVLCPKHPDIVRTVFTTKNKANEARRVHLLDEHQSGDVICG